MSLWQIEGTGPVIAPGQLHGVLDERRAGAPHVVEMGDRYRMVYWGSDGGGKNRILQAEAPIDSPNDWRPFGEPLLEPQPHLDFNSQGPSFPFLLPIDERRWLLYFCGWGRSIGGKLANTTGVAVSEDSGEHWSYHEANPVIPLDRPYDREATGSIWILRDGEALRMYYTAIGRYFSKPEGVETGHGDTIPEIGIGYAESTDGFLWTKPVDHLLVSPRAFGVEPYEYICSKPCIIRSGDGYIMWLNTFGIAYRVHRLHSDDGLAWRWSERVGPDGELGCGMPGTFDDRQRSYPTIVVHDGEYRCWYTGNGFGTTGIGYATMGVS